MKTIQIALNTLTRSFRSAFALAFMFAIPLLMAGLFSLMFGGSSAPAAQAAAAEQPAARLVVANLDRGDPALTQGMAMVTPNMPPAESQLGAALVQALNGEAYAALLQVSPAPDQESAIQAVRSGKADAALVIPTNFSANYVTSGAQSDLLLYQDPNRSSQGGLIGALLTPFTDLFAGMKITMNVAYAQPRISAVAVGADNPLITRIVQGYLTEKPNDPAQVLVDVQTPMGAAAQLPTPTSQVVAPILGGMMIFFAFFTACNTTLGLLHEQENGTLARLFSTPTALSSILGGKFAAVGLTVLVQICVLLSAGRLIFSIQWGSLVCVAMAALGATACATAFGIFATSLLKNIRQGGMVFGGLLTVTGMLGMMSAFTGGGSTPLISLFTPQGWAVRGLQLAMNGAEPAEAALNLLVLLALSVIFYAAGSHRFQKRFA